MEVKGNKVYIRASQLSKIMTGDVFITDSEMKKLNELEKRRDGLLLHATTCKPLAFSGTNSSDLKKLLDKKNNPQLSKTAKSYIDEIVIESLTGVYNQISSKYTDHGNQNEDISIIQVQNIIRSIHKSNGIESNVVFKKNDIRFNREDLKLTGEVDHLPDADYLIDYKNPYTTITLDKSRNELIEEYEWQGQAYCEGYNKSACYFIFTLNEHEYMLGNEYDNIKPLDRLNIHKVERDPMKIEAYKLRLPLIEKYIDEKIQSIISCTKRTRNFLLEIAQLESKEVM